jgi:hypothetical protein
MTQLTAYQGLHDLGRHAARDMPSADTRRLRPVMAMTFKKLPCGRLAPCRAHSASTHVYYYSQLYTGRSPSRTSAAFEA